MQASRSNGGRRELERYIALDIVGTYHQSIHSSLGRPPIAVWREHEGEIPLRLPQDRLRFWLTFLPEQERTLRPTGIHLLNTLRFLSNRLQISLVCFGVNEAREAISGDVQLARRFEQFTLSRWAANEQFETLVTSILCNTPLHRPSVLTPKSLRRILQITEGITANIFHMINSLAIDAIKNRREHVTDEMVENWESEFDAEAAFA